MQLTPRYDSDPILALDGDPASIGAPAVRQTRRLVDRLGDLTEEQWAHQTRCDAWTVRDVIVHLTITNQFWAMSVLAGLAGDPTKILANFDPAASPLEMGATNVDLPDKVLADFAEATDGWAGVIEGLSDEDWRATAEAPPGHISVSAVVHHALWDSWIHERDIFVPLAGELIEEPDEISKSLRYAIGLGVTLDLSRDNARTGAVAFDVAQPTDTFTLVVEDSASVESGRVGEAPVVESDAVPLLEGLSLRAPMPVELGEDVAWVFEGLKAAFDQ